MRAIPEVITKAPAPVYVEWQDYAPIQWEQERHKVWRAMVVHRWAALKIRQLSRDQYAKDWGSTVEKRVWEWSRAMGQWLLPFARLIR